MDQVLVDLGKLCRIRFHALENVGADARPLEQSRSLETVLTGDKVIAATFAGTRHDRLQQPIDLIDSASSATRSGRSARRRSALTLMPPRPTLMVLIGAGPVIARARERAGGVDPH